MDAIAAHKDELEKLLQDLSGDSVVSRITFVACVDAYIMRLDINYSDLNACVTPPPAHRDSELTYGINIDSKLRALLRAAQNFKTARGVLSMTSRCGRQTRAGCLPATAARRTVQAFIPLPGQRTLIDITQQVKHEDRVKEVKSESRSSSQKRSAPDNVRGKPKYLFRGVVK
jgi:hypothetical protein